MKELEKYVAQCQRDLDSVGIPCGKVRRWEINTRAKARWGLCKCLKGGDFVISIARILLEDDVEDQALKDTIVHELLHTAPGCLDHKGKWKMYAELVNRKLPQYTIKRTASREEKGITVQRAEPVCRYVVRCCDCGTEFPRERESKLIKHPEQFRCGLCHGRLIRSK